MSYLSLSTLAKGSRKNILGRKRAGKEQQQESSKKQKVEKEKESDKVDEAKLNKLLVIKKDKDIAIDAIPLASKLPVIIDYKLHKEGMMVHYQLIRADGSSKRYSSMIRMLQGIDKEDLEALWRIVKAKYGDTRPKNEFERVLWGDLKVMFEPDIRSNVWRMLQGYRVTVRSSNHSNDLETESSFVLSRTSVYGSVQWILPSIKTRISLIKLEFSSCLFANSPINLLKSIQPFLGWLFFASAEVFDDSVMSDSDESGVTYTEMSSTFEELSDIGSPGVEDEMFLAEEQPLPTAASPTAQSPDYEVDIEADDDEEEEDPAPADSVVVALLAADQAPSADSVVDIEVDDEEEEEHPAPADSVVVALLAADQAPSAEETEPFETDESAATPPPHPAYRVTARISIPAPVPTPVWSDAEVARLLAISTPPLSPLSPWSSLLTLW
ncbi:hypothetical protein Tco_0409249 [Tanacetum coccineum]